MENEIFLEGGGLNNTGGSSRTRGPTVMLATPGSYIGNPAWGGYSIGAPSELATTHLQLVMLGPLVSPTPRFLWRTVG